MHQSSHHIHETTHFRVHCAVESFAARNAAVIAGRLEQARGIMGDLLGMDAHGLETIDVYLSEMLEDPRQPGVPLFRGGYATPNRGEIHQIYRADAPGEGLERSLLLVLLGYAAGEERSWPALIVDGLLARVMSQLGSFPPDEQGMQALTAAKARGELPSVATLLSGPAPATKSIYYPVAAGFVGFLIRAYGLDRLKEFVCRLEPGAPDNAARAAYGRTLAQLEKAWHRSIRASTPGGVPRFVKLSGRYLQPYRLQVVEIVVYIALSVGFGVGLARMQGILLDKALAHRDLHVLAVIMGVLVGAFIVVSLVSLRQNYLSAYVAESVMREMRLRIFTRLQRLHPGFFQTMQTGDIMSRMTSDLSAVQFALTGALAQGLRVILTLIFATVTIFWQDWKLAIVAMVGTPLLFATGRYLGPAAARASAERQRRLAGVTSALQENLGAQPVVKAFGLQERMIGGYGRDLDRVFRSSLRLTYLTGIFGVSTNFVASSIQLTVLGVGAWLVIGGSLTAGTLFSFLALIGQIIGPLQNISGILQSLQQASGAMDRVEELLLAEPAIKDAPEAVGLAPLSDAIRFEDVSFSYADGQPTLRDLTIAIPAGSSVALVGPSGCGKSTVLNLIMRFYDARRGRVTVDGIDVREATLDSLRGQMGVVFQDNVLFDLSIRENIRLGNLAATDAEVEAAAKAAEIHDLIMSMLDGYDTVVGERGGRLSGGQRQRVAIARAMIRNPAILILDEATSALDSRTEAAINETLNRLARGRTTISVTHRLTSVVNADQIYVLDQGALVEQGTHDDLVQQGGLYARLWREQAGSGAAAGVQYVGVEASRLRHVPIFAHLDANLLAAVARRFLVERYPAGAVIVNEGDTGDKMYIIHRGHVEVLSSDSAGDHRLRAVLREGDHFGEMALLYDVPRTATIRARAPVQLYSLSKDDLSDLLAAEPGLQDILERIIAARTLASAAREAGQARVSQPGPYGESEDSGHASSHPLAKAG